jgi:hypothetical protein
MTIEKITILESFITVGSFDCDRTKAASILKWVIIAREGSSKLGVLSSLPPLFFVDILQTTSGSFDT